ncbi:hypothetical protein BZG36_00167 [Bifiguratus adelaidae]|uniref:Protein-S-isoprenylcysteine O-methyltransferase n=1 Tax=Bifiguratus adelaidae TaxID=1938954 RepID=A0A261Y829_9FUNG|nr:hypothetical protein BZG36_00167 [Bifiguratus adelaidae]
MPFTLVLGYALAAFNLASDGTFREDVVSLASGQGGLSDIYEQSGEFSTSHNSAGLGRLVTLSTLVALIAPIFTLTPLGIPDWVGWFGLGWMLGGMAIGFWAKRVNRFFLGDNQGAEEQFICTDGPYKVIRHPIFLGQLLFWFGFGLSSCNWFVFLIISVVMLLTYHRRILFEEELMFSRLGADYQAYVDETARILPFIY